MIAVVVVSKDEPALEDTLSDLHVPGAATGADIVVVDASSGRLEDIRQRFTDVRWIDFTAPEGMAGRVTIPHQRNVGLRATSGADCVVFVDAGCRLGPDWLRLLSEPILRGTEDVTVGRSVGSGAWSYLYERDADNIPEYVDEAPTMNLALSRRIIDAIGDFDEHFEYGSDIDYTWRIVNSGTRIRSVREAVVSHDWGDRRRQLRRTYAYGKARARLHRKHATPLRDVLKREPATLAYPLFILLLPLALVFPGYLLLLAIPAWRARHSHPAIVILSHLVYSIGLLAEILRRSP